LLREAYTVGIAAPFLVGSLALAVRWWTVRRSRQGRWILCLSVLFGFLGVVLAVFSLYPLAPLLLADLVLFGFAGAVLFMIAEMLSGPSSMGMVEASRKRQSTSATGRRTRAKRSPTD